MLLYTLLSKNFSVTVVKQQKEHILRKGSRGSLHHYQELLQYLHTHKQKDKTHQKCFFFFKISINCYQSLWWKKFAPNSKPHSLTLKATGCGFFTFSFLFLSANGAAYNSVMLRRRLEFIFLLLQNHLWEVLKSFHPSQALITGLGGDVKWILKMSTCHLSYISNLEILRERFSEGHSLLPPLSCGAKSCGKHSREFDNLSIFCTVILFGAGVGWLWDPLPTELHYRAYSLGLAFFFFFCLSK